MDPAVIGNNIRSIRESLGLTQEDVAIRMGVSRQSIYKYERGLAKVALRKISTLENIAVAISTDSHIVTVEDILMLGEQ